MRFFLRSILDGPRVAARAAEFMFRRVDAADDIYPADPARGEVVGPDPVRLVVIGEAGMISLGVRTHDLCLPAFLARHHTGTTGQGVSWTIAALPAARLGDAPLVVDGIRGDLRAADAVVVLVGITDVLRVVPLATWERQMQLMLDALVAAVPAGVRVSIAEIPPLDNAGSMSRPARVAAGVHGRAVNRRTRSVASAYPSVQTLPFPEELTTSLWRPESEERRYVRTYKVWGASLSPALLAGTR